MNKNKSKNKSKARQDKIGQDKQGKTAIRQDNHKTIQDTTRHDKIKQNKTRKEGLLIRSQSFRSLSCVVLPFVTVSFSLKVPGKWMVSLETPGFLSRIVYCLVLFCLVLSHCVVVSCLVFYCLRFFSLLFLSFLFLSRLVSLCCFRICLGICCVLCCLRVCPCAVLSSLTLAQYGKFL